VGNVGHEPKFSARPQHARDLGQARILHEAPLPMPALRPRIRIAEVHAGKPAGRQPAHDIGGVAVVQPDIVELAIRNGRQCLGHAVDEGLDPDEAGPGMLLRLRNQIFTAAKPDLEPDCVDR
jgi:hypothetical protein